MEGATATQLRLPTWLAALGPLVLIAALLAAFVAWDPLTALRPVPPVESVAVERTTLDEGRITLQVRNDGPDPVTIAQVLVNEAYWNFSATDRTLGRLDAATITIPYPWDEGTPVDIALVTSTGVTIEHHIEVAVTTPGIDATTLFVYSLLGLYIGVVPVAVGLLWFPALARASPRWLGFFLAFTAGLLAFLLVDTVEEGVELSGRAGASLNALGLLAIGAVGAVIFLVLLQSALARRSGEVAPLALAYLVAGGIGVHNLGEGLAVGAAVAAGELALGTFLVVGFALHNTTEGLAIVAPLGRRPRPALAHFVGLGAVAGAPTILGAWGGAFAFSPAWATFAFGIAAGAIAQVVWVIVRQLPGEARLSTAPGALGFVAGLVAMYLTGLLAA